MAGSWNANNFSYNPQLTTQGTTDYAAFNTSQDRIDARLGKEIWVGDPNYSTTLQDAITAIGSNEVILRVPAGTHSVNADLTIPANITLKPERGAILAVATTKTLTINGSIDAGLYQIFSCTGTGAVSLSGAVREVYAQWFGALADGTTDDHAAIQKAIDSNAFEVVLPNFNSNTTNPGTVLSTNYYLGTTGLTITRPIRFRMAQGTSLVYAGTDAPLVVDCHAAPIEGLVLNLYDVYSSGTGAYCIKVVGDGTAIGTTASVARAKINAHWLTGFTTAGFFTKWCMFVENILNLQNIRAANTGLGDASDAPNAWGYYFDPTDQPAPKLYIHEANHINTITVNSRRALSGTGANFDQNIITIGTDYGSLAFDVTQENMVIGGGQNVITIATFNLPPASGAQTFRVVKVHFLSGAVNNVYICPANLLSGIIEENGPGGNTYLLPNGAVNYLVNPSFEAWTGPNPDGWTLNCTVAADTTYVMHGLKSIAVTSVGALQNMSQAIPADLNGKPINVSGWFMSPATNTGAAAFGFTYTEAPNSSLTAIPNDGLWHFYSMPLDGTLLTNVVFQIFADTGAVNQTIYVDGLFLGKGYVPTMLQTINSY